MYSHVFGACDRQSVGWTKAARQQRPSFTGVWPLWSSDCWVNESNEATEAIIYRCLAPVIVGVLGEPETLHYTCCSIIGWTKATRQQWPRGKKHKLSVRLLNCLVTTVITDWCTNTFPCRRRLRQRQKLPLFLQYCCDCSLSYSLLLFLLLPCYH